MSITKVNLSLFEVIWIELKQTRENMKCNSYCFSFLIRLRKQMEVQCIFTYDFSEFHIGFVYPFLSVYFFHLKSCPCHHPQSSHFLMLEMYRCSSRHFFVSFYRIFMLFAGLNCIIGGRLVYQSTKKRASGPKCPVTGKRIQGVCHCSVLILSYCLRLYI